MDYNTTKEDIIRMAREIGWIDYDLAEGREMRLVMFAEHFAALVAAAEREACAKECKFGRSSADIEQAIRSALAEKSSGTEQPDKGPWHVGVTRNDSRVYLQSNDFKHDVRLYVDGDFADLKQRIEYAERLKRNMNGEDHPAQRKPLTDEEIDSFREANSEGRGAGWRFNFKGFARAIEAAHGIKEKNT